MRRKCAGCGAEFDDSFRRPACPHPLYPHAALFAIENIAGKGRGVVARASFAAGDVIMADPVVEFDEHDVDERSPLFSYPFMWTPGSDVLALGLSNLCNHSASPNTRFEREHETRILRLVALRDIAPGDEITIDYVKPWFDVVE